MRSTMQGEILLGLRYIRNKARSTNFSSRVSYCLIYGISETLGEGEQLIHGVNYYLNYGISETTCCIRR